MGLFNKKKGIKEIETGISQFVTSEFQTINSSLVNYYDINEDCLLCIMLSIATQFAELSLKKRNIVVDRFADEMLLSFFETINLPEELQFQTSQVYFQVDSELRLIKDEEENCYEEFAKYIYDNCVLSSKMENVTKEMEKGNITNTFKKLINAFQENIDAAINDKNIQIVL